MSVRPESLPMVARVPLTTKRAGKGFTAILSTFSVTQLRRLSLYSSDK
jgi:hypothetical protein